MSKRGPVAGQPAPDEAAPTLVVASGPQVEAVDAVTRPVSAPSSGRSDVKAEEERVLQGLLDGLQRTFGEERRQTALVTAAESEGREYVQYSGSIASIARSRAVPEDPVKVRVRVGDGDGDPDRAAPTVVLPLRRAARGPRRRGAWPALFLAAIACGIGAAAAVRSGASRHAPALDKSAARASPDPSAAHAASGDFGASTAPSAASASTAPTEPSATAAPTRVRPKRPGVAGGAPHAAAAPAASAGPSSAASSSWDAIYDGPIRELRTQ